MSESAKPVLPFILNRKDNTVWYLLPGEKKWRGPYANIDAVMQKDAAILPFPFVIDYMTEQEVAARAKASKGKDDK